MGVSGAEQPLCSCYKECQEFHKVIELKDTGLVVYCHTTCREDVIQGGVVGSAISTSQDVFILQNTKDVKITSADLLPALEKNDISCPRCRQLFEHAQELLQKVTLIDKKNVMGICDQCRLKAQFDKKTCSECEEIVKKFLSLKSEQNEDTKRFIKIWLSKMKHLFKDAVPSDKPKHHRTRACSELRIDRLCQYSPRSTREPVVKQMFHSEIHKSDTNLYTDMTDAKLNEQHKLVKSVIFTESAESLEIPYGGERLKMSRPGPSHLESDATLVEPNEEDKDRPKILKEHRGKPDHVSEYSAKKKIYDIPKIAPWEQQEPSEHESATDVKIATKKYVSTLESESRDLRSTSQKPKTSQKISENYVESITDMKQPSKQKHDLTSKHMIPEKEKLGHGKLKKATDDSEISTKLLKREDRYLTDDEIKFQRSVSKFSHEMEKTGQREMKTTTKGKKPIQFEEPPENIVRKQFSYFFPKGKEAKKPQLGARSSQLIKNTQEKLRHRDEEEKRKHEEERIKKLEEDEKKRLAREEKKRLADEKRKQAEEKKKIVDQKKIFDELQRKKHSEEELEKKLPSEKEKKRLDDDKNQEEPLSDQTKKSKEKRDTMPGSKQKGEKEKELKDTQKGLKQKIELEKETGKAKKDIKTKSEPKDKLDEEKQKTTKESKPKLEKSYEVPEKSKKDLKTKTDMKEIIDKEAKMEKEKKESKSKTEQKDKIEKQKQDEVEKEKKDDGGKVKKDVVEKEIKDLKSKTEIEKDAGRRKDLTPKTETKDTIDKDADKRQKEKDKQAVKEQLQRETEEKDRSNLMEQLRKEKEAASSKKQDSPKESAKKNLESTKEKKVPPKNMEDLPKEKEIEDLSKKSKETKIAPKKLQDVSKEKVELVSTNKQVPPTEIEKLKQDSIKEKEGKVKTSPKKEDKSKDDTIKSDGASKKAKEDKLKPNEESKEDKNKGEDASKKNKEDKSKAIEESKEHTSKVQATSKREKDGMDEGQFRTLQAELAKQKEEDLKRKRQNEADTQKARELADIKAKEEEEGKLKKLREAKAEFKPEPKRRSVEKKDMPKQSTIKELKLDQTKMCRRSSDDLILRLVKLRQTAPGDRIKARPCDIDPEIIQAHKSHQKSGLFSSACELCNDSELEIDVESYDNKINLKASVEEIIFGEKILKYKGPILEESEQEVIPMLFKSVFKGDTAPLPLKDIVTIIPEEPAPEKNILAAFLPKKDTKGEQVEESGKGIIRYALSDRTFIDKGWTMLPTEKVVRKMNVYRMRPAHPEFDWFEHNKNKRLMTYDTGEKLAEFDDNGRGRWYYRSGRLALDYYDAEETNAQQRFVVYSSGEPDERGRTHPFTILATFDYLGNGIVFDHAGKIRLKYNQTEGVVLDRGIGPVSHWKWHTLNDPPVLQQVMIDTQMAHKDPQIFKLGSPADVKTRPDNEEMLAIEFDNFIKEKSKKLSQKFKPFQIKMKALKINEHFSLKVLDQATIYLIYRDGSTNLKLNIGMILDHQEIVDTDTAEVGEVSNNLERFPARTDSLAGLQRSVAYAQRYERQRTERERRLRPSEPCASADQLTAAASSPLRPPLRTMPAGSTSSGLCKCRKPSSNLYYNTRLL